MNNDDLIWDNGLSSSDIEELAYPEQSKEEDINALGFVEEQPTQQENKSFIDKVYDAADTLDIEHPDKDKQYQKLSKIDTLKDVGKSVFVEASHLFAPKNEELYYESKTRIGETLKYLYRYGAGAIPFFISGAGVGGAILKGVQVSSKIGKLTKGQKIAQAIGKVLAGKTFQAKEGAGILSKAGTWFTNKFLTGGVLSLPSDFLYFRPEEEEHFADIFPKNKALSFLQTDENDTEVEAKFKNAAEGFMLGGVTGIGFDLALKPVAKKLLSSKLAKGMFASFKFSKANTDEEVKEALQSVIKNEEEFNKLVNSFDVENEVDAILKESVETGEDAEEILLNRVPLEKREEAREMLRMKQSGDEIFHYEDGTWGLKVTKYDDADRISPEEFKKQLQERDIQKAKDVADTFGTDIPEDKIVREGDTALKLQDEAVKETWEQRGLIGNNENLINETSTGKKTGNKTAAKKIVKSYKDKWEIDNNIDIEFVDGLKDSEGKPVQGRTDFTKNTGKNKKQPKKVNQEAVDKKKLQIKQLEDKITMLEGGNGEISDPLDVLKEQLRIAKNELKKLENVKPFPEKIPNIVISIDINAKNPYATLRSELEHARDVAKGTVPDQTTRHFSRYEGMSEAEVAPDFVIHKAEGKRKFSRAEKQNRKATQENNLKKLDETYTFEREIPEIEENPIDDTEHFQTVRMKDKNGKIVADCTIEIDGDGAILPFISKWDKTHKHTASNLFAGLVTKYFPNKKIRWKATSEASVKSYNKFCKDFPELAEKVDFVDVSKNYQPVIDKDIPSLYASEKGVDSNGKGSNNSQVRGRSEGTVGEQPSSDSGSPSAQDLLQGERTSGGTLGTGTMDESISTSNERRNISNGSDRPKQITKKYNPDRETYQEKLVREQSEQAQADVTHSEYVAKTTGRTSEDIIRGINSGDVVLKTVADIDSLVSQVADETADIRDWSFRTLAEQGDDKAAKFLQADVPAYKKLFADGDINLLNSLAHKELAAAKVISSLKENLINLGVNAPQDNKRALVDAIVGLTNYINGLRSGAGGLLNSQKLANRALSTFGNTELSKLNQEGLEKLTDLLSKEIKERFSLNFTEGKAIDIAKEQRTFLKDFILKYDKDGNFSTMLTQNPELIGKFTDVITKAIKNKGNTESLRKDLLDIMSESNYDAAYKAIMLSKDSETTLKVVNSITEGGLDNTISYYIHNLLSGFPTVEKNVISGIFTTAYYPLAKIVGGMMGGNSEIIREGVNTFRFMKDSLVESLGLACRHFMLGDDAILPVRDVGEDIKVNLKPLQWNDEKSALQNLFDGLQNIHSIMSRVMGFSDDVLRELNYRSVVRSKLYNTAEKILGESATEEEIQEFIRMQFKNKFDKYGQPTDMESLFEAKEILFQAPLDRKMADNVQYGETGLFLNGINELNKAINKEGKIFKFVFPFLRTGANIAQFSYETSPVVLFGDTVASVLNRKAKGIWRNDRQGALARGKLALGCFSFTLAYLAAMSGNITGSPPADLKERQALFKAGWKPYSIRTADGKYISYQGIEPFQTFLGLAADSVEIYSNRDEKEWNKITGEIMGTLAENMLDKAAFRGGINIINTFFNADDPDKVSQILANQARGFLPMYGMVKHITSFGQHDDTQPKEFKDRVLNKYGSFQGDYRRNYFGERQRITTGILTNSSDTTMHEEDVEMVRLAELGYSPREVQDTIDETGIKLSDYKNPKTKRSLRDLVNERMSEITINGMTIREACANLFSSPEYQELSDVDVDTLNEKKKLVNDIFIQYRNLAKEEVLEEEADEYVDNQGHSLRDSVDDYNAEVLAKQIELNLNSVVDKIIDF